MNELYRVIEKKIKASGYPRAISGEAVYDDICDQIEGKENGMYILLSKFEEDVVFEYHITILDDDFNLTRREVVNVPIVGHVAAGEPILATENIENYFPIPVEYMPNEETFMLKVKGESMINAGILDGDFVLVEQSDVADNGDIVVALLEDFRKSVWRIPFSIILTENENQLTGCFTDNQSADFHPFACIDIYKNLSFIFMLQARALLLFFYG